MARPPAEPWPDAHALDEVELAVGPDRDALGIFDAPTTGTATGEHTHGSASEPEQGGEPRRTAVLAWIAAQDLSGAPAVGQQPCAALKRLIADEPLDVVPALDGTEHRDPPALPAGGEPEDTATQILGFEALLDRGEREDATQTDIVAPPRAPASRPRLPSPAQMLLLALCALITAWFLLFIR
jgi:hypothetical protein